MTPESSVAARIFERHSGVGCLSAQELIVAAARKDTAAVLTHLTLGGEADITVCGKPTALCYSALVGDSDVTMALLRAGARVNFQDKVGNTPLIYAAIGNSLASAELLLSHGANPFLRNNSQQCARCFLQCSGREKSQMAELLTEYQHIGINFGLWTEGGHTSQSR